jgi:mannose-1-phosphate guanylyltransferase
MLRLMGDSSLFQIAVRRLSGVFPPERIFVVTVDEQAAELQEQCPEIPQQNYLLEPMPRGTASVVGLAAVALQQRDPDAVMAILTADHFIANEAGFRRLLLAGFDVAQDGYLVTLGISPTYPATGYGYIQRGDFLGAYRDMDVFHALRFREKPDEQQARLMLAGGDHSWNSGMFIWRVDRIQEEFERQMPPLFTSLQQIASAWGVQDLPAVIGRVWPKIKPETIDYGIMEGAEKVAVIPASGLGWNDVGSWDSLFDVLSGDENGNILMNGRHLSLDTGRSLVFGEDPSRLIVTIGIEDLVVVDTGDVLMICHKDQAQKVRDVVNLLKQAGGNHL